MCLVYISRSQYSEFKCKRLQYQDVKKRELFHRVQVPRRTLTPSIGLLFILKKLLALNMCRCAHL